MTGPVDPYALSVAGLLDGLGSLALPVWLAGNTLLIATIAWLVMRESFGREPAASAVFLAACLLLLLWARLPSVALSEFSNPDESFWIASASALVENPSPWKTVDTTTGGPLVPVPVMITGLLAGSFGWGTARVAAIGLWLLTIPFLYGAMVRRFKVRTAQLGLLPIIVSAAFFANEWDFISYNSEHVANLLLAIALFADVILVTREKTDRDAMVPLLALGIALGATPWAKLQVAPIAAFYGVVRCAQLLRNGEVRSTITLAGSALIPTIIVLVVVAATGVLSDFWQSYFAHTIHYATAGLEGMFGGEPVALRTALVRYPIAVLRNVDVLPLVVATLGLAIVSSIAWVARHHRPTPVVLFAAALVVTAGWTTIQTREVFGHYLLLLFVPLTFLNAALIDPFTSIRDGSSRPIPNSVARFVLAFVVFAFLVPAALLMTVRNRAFNEATRPVTPASVMPAAVAVIDSLTQPGDRVAIWGWASPLWIASRTLPGTRDVHTARQLMPGDMQPYFINRFARDLDERQPILFVDAVARISHFSDVDRYGFHNYKPVAEIVQRDYTLVGEADDVRIYVRRTVRNQRANGRS